MAHCPAKSPPSTRRQALRRDVLGQATGDETGHAFLGLGIQSVQTEPKIEPVAPRATVDPRPVVVGPDVMTRIQRLKPGLDVVLDNPDTPTLCTPTPKTRRSAEPSADCPAQKSSRRSPNDRTEPQRAHFDSLTGPARPAQSASNAGPAAVQGGPLSWRREGRLPCGLESRGRSDQKPWDSISDSSGVGTGETAGSTHGRRVC